MTSQNDKERLKAELLRFFQICLPGKQYRKRYFEGIIETIG